MELARVPAPDSFPLSALPENLYPISLCELNTKLNQKCSADWSQSNLISVVTPDGIYLLKPQLNVPDGPFEIELIRNPTNKFKHKVLDDENSEKNSFDNNWSRLNHHQYMEIFLDPTLNTNIDSLSLNLYPRQYRFARWSPILSTYPKQCLLAVVTTDHQLLIFKRATHGWRIEFDLSEEYDKLWSQFKSNNKQSTQTGTSTNNDEDLKTTLTFQQIKNDIHSLSFCSVCWKTTKNNQLLLLAATIPGDIVVWQFIYSNQTNKNETQGNSASSLRLEVKLILKANLFYINTMNLFQDLLILSSQDGQIILYDLTMYLKQLFSGQSRISQSHRTVKQEYQQVDKNWAEILNYVDLQPTAILWNRDNIEVADFYIQPISGDCFRIVMAKATNICWSLIYYTQENNDQPAKLAISDSFSAVDGRDPEVALNQSPVTSLKPAGQQKSLLIADDGSFFQLEFVDGQQDTMPEFSTVKTGKIDLTRLVPKGLCTSPNGHLVTMISHITLQYEPDKITTPTKLILLPTNNNKDFFVECTKRLSSESYLREMNYQSPMDIMDIIDYIRSAFPLLSVEQSSEIYKTLIESCSLIIQIENTSQAVKCKIMLFLLLKLFEQPSHESTVTTNKIGDLILSYNIGNVLNEALSPRPKSGSEKGDESFSTEQLISLRNYRDWLVKEPSERAGVLEKYKERLESILRPKTAKIPAELCPICQTKIPFLSPYYGICNNGHKFDRCARSLIILNLESASEYVCEHCKRHYMTNLIWPSENLWLCWHCQ